MPDMIERVARAICQANCDNPDEADFAFLSDTVRGYAWQGYIPHARSAIRAMRELPKEMLDEGCDAFGDPIGRGEYFWQTMIDRLLEEQ